MSIEQLAETVKQRLADSPIYQQDTNRISRGLRVRNVIECVVEDAGVDLSDEELKALAKLVTNSTR